MPVELAAVWSWGDPELVVSALQPAGARVFTVCGRGETPLALLAEGPSRLLVNDSRAEARSLFALKLASARTLPRPTLRSLFGLDEAGRRVFLYHYVREGKMEGRGPPPPGLEDEARQFWDPREALLRAGLASAGQRERKEARVRRLLGSRSGSRSRGRLPIVAAVLFGPDLGPTRAGRFARRLAHLAREPGPLVQRILAGPAAVPDPARWMEVESLARILGGRPVELGGESTGRALARLPAASLDAISLGVAGDTAELDAAARALAAGGRLLVRAPAAPTAPAGLLLDRTGSLALQDRDQALVLEPPWLFRRA